MGNLSLKPLCIIFLILSISFSVQAKQKKPFPRLTRSELQKVKKKVKTPEFGFFVLTRFKNNWSVLKLFQRHIPASDFKYLKARADKLGIKFKDKFNLKLAGNGHLILNGEKIKYSKTGQEILYKNSIFKLNKQQSLEWNYKNITKQLSTIAALNSKCSLFMPCSFADDGPSLGYNLMVALYYMNVWETGHAEIHWEGYLEEDEVQTALQNVAGRGVQIENVECNDEDDKKGMTLHFINSSTGERTSSEIMWNQKSGEELRMTVEDKKGPMTSGIGMGEYDHTRAADAWFYYCSMLDAQGKYKIVDLLNKNILDPHLMEDHSGGVQSTY